MVRAGFFSVRDSIRRDFPEIFAPELKGPKWRERGAEDLGDWGLIVRETASWDAARVSQLLQWPIRELLLAYISLLKKNAQERYALDLQVWAALAPHQKDPAKPPKPPSILRS